MVSKILTTAILLLLFAHAQPTNGQADYEEINNIVVIEAENLDSIDNWTIETSAAGYSGTGYLEWDQGQFLGNPGNGTMAVRIKINDPGTYYFLWRSKVGFGNSSTDHNDSWLRFDDAAAFYAEDDNGNRVYPVGRGTPNPVGASANGWFKVYSSGTTNWTWSTLTNDHDGHDIYVRFDTAGIYTMEISARSEHHFLDRIVLSKNYNNPTDLNLPETPFILNAVHRIPHQAMAVFPNPLETSNTVTVNGIQKGTYTYTIVDWTGKCLYQTQLNCTDSTQTLTCPPLNSGVYLLRLDNGQKAYTAKLMVP